MGTGNQITFSTIAPEMLLICVFWASFGHAQQIPQYSQYTFNSLYINPAYAGYKIDPFV